MPEDPVTCGRCGETLDGSTEGMLRHLEQHGIDWTESANPEP